MWEGRTGGSPTSDRENGGRDHLNRPVRNQQNRSPATRCIRRKSIPNCLPAWRRTSIRRGPRAAVLVPQSLLSPLSRTASVPPARSAEVPADLRDKSAKSRPSRSGAGGRHVLSESESISKCRNCGLLRTVTVKPIGESLLGNGSIPRRSPLPDGVASGIHESNPVPKSSCRIQITGADEAACDSRPRQIAWIGRNLRILQSAANGS